MTAEQLAAAKSIVQHAAVNSLETDEVMLLGHALKEIDCLRAELDRLRAQGGEMPERIPLVHYDNSWEQNSRRLDGSYPREVYEDGMNRGYELAIHFMRKSLTAPPHPDTVEVDEEYLTDLEDSVRQLMGEKMEIEWDLSPMPERIKQARALRSAQAQPTNETRG